MGQDSKRRKQRHLERVAAGKQNPVSKSSQTVPASVTDIGRRANEFFRRDDLVPGCYDDPAFRALEELDPTILERYALHVLTEGAKRNAGREDAMKGVVEKFSAVLAGMSAAESQGKCYQLTGTLIRSLEMIGVWCFGAKGAISVYTSANPRGAHLHAIDTSDFGGEPGHFWVVAPPFTVIDCSIYYQGWHPSVMAAMDRLVLSKKTIPEPPNFERLAAPMFRRDLRALATFAELQQRFWTWLNCFRIEQERATLHYTPYGITLPLEPATAISFGGRPLKVFIEGF